MVKLTKKRKSLKRGGGWFRSKIKAVKNKFKSSKANFYNLSTIKHGTPTTSKKRKNLEEFTSKASENARVNAATFAASQQPLLKAVKNYNSSLKRRKSEGPYGFGPNLQESSSTNGEQRKSLNLGNRGSSSTNVEPPKVNLDSTRVSIKSENNFSELQNLLKKLETKSNLQETRLTQPASSAPPAPTLPSSASLPAPSAPPASASLPPPLKTPKVNIGPTTGSSENNEQTLKELRQFLEGEEAKEEQISPKQFFPSSTSASASASLPAPPAPPAPPSSAPPASASQPASASPPNMANVLKEMMNSSRLKKSSPSPSRSSSPSSSPPSLPLSLNVSKMANALKKLRRTGPPLVSNKEKEAAIKVQQNLNEKANNRNKKINEAVKAAASARLAEAAAKKATQAAQDAQAEQDAAAILLDNEGKPLPPPPPSLLPPPPPSSSPASISKTGTGTRKGINVVTIRPENTNAAKRDELQEELKQRLAKIQNKINRGNEVFTSQIKTVRPLKLGPTGTTRIRNLGPPLTLRKSNVVVSKQNSPFGPRKKTRTQPMGESTEQRLKRETQERQNALNVANAEQLKRGARPIGAGQIK